MDRRSNGKIWAAALFLLAAAAVPVWSHDPKAEESATLAAFAYEPPAAGSYVLPVIRAAPDGKVLNSRGQAQSLQQVLSDRVILLSLVYANCETECPLATSTLFDLFYGTADAPDLANNLKLVSLSFDPARDTPAAMAAFGASALAEPGGKSPWAFLTTTGVGDLKPILRGLGQSVLYRPSGAIGHLLRVYLIDRRGRVRNIYGLETLDPRLLLADVRTLLLEEAAPALAGKP